MPGLFPRQLTPPLGLLVETSSPPWDANGPCRLGRVWARTTGPCEARRPSRENAPERAHSCLLFLCHVLHVGQAVGGDDGGLAGASQPWSRSRTTWRAFKSYQCAGTTPRLLGQSLGDEGTTGPWRPCLFKQPG